MPITNIVTDDYEATLSEITALRRHLIVQLRWQIDGQRGPAYAARHDCDVWRRRAKESEATTKMLCDALKRAKGVA